MGDDLGRLQAKAELTEIEMNRLKNSLTLRGQIQAHEKELELNNYRAQIEQVKKKIAKMTATKRDNKQKMVIETQHTTVEIAEQGSIIQETLFDGPVPTDAELEAQSRHSTPTLESQMEVGGDEQAEIYQHQREF